MNICKRYTIQGRVQGVFYRANTQKIAKSLGLTGWACNEPDGSVTVYACGESQALVELEKWLHRGPPAATVENVIVFDAQHEPCEGFEVR